MFSNRYFSSRYFAARYFAAQGAVIYDHLVTATLAAVRLATSVPTATGDSATLTVVRTARAPLATLPE